MQTNVPSWEKLKRKTRQYQNNEQTSQWIYWSISAWNQSTTQSGDQCTSQMLPEWLLSTSVTSVLITNHSDNHRELRAQRSLLVRDMSLPMIATCRELMTSHWPRMAKSLLTGKATAGWAKITGYWGGHVSRGETEERWLNGCGESRGID